VNEAYISRIRVGQPARITLDAYPDTSFAGRVRLIVPTADRDRATVQVKVALTGRDARILPEMGARVDFLAPQERVASGAGTAGAAAPRFLVPAAAVRDDSGRTVVWVVQQGRLARRVVTAGPTSGGLREVRDGLLGGEVVVVGGVEHPQVGQRVTVQPR
jgi:HlyD family secretion protein